MHGWCLKQNTITFGSILYTCGVHLYNFDPPFRNPGSGPASNNIINQIARSLANLHSEVFSYQIIQQGNDLFNLM